MGVLEKTLLESNQQMQIIARQQATMANHQVMMSTPPEVRNVYFDEIYKTINLKTTNRRVEEEVRQLALLSRKRELEMVMVDENNNDNVDQQAGVSDTNNEDGPDKKATMFGDFTDQSRWVQLWLDGNLSMPLILLQVQRALYLPVFTTGTSMTS